MSHARSSESIDLKDGFAKELCQGGNEGRGIGWWYVWWRGWQIGYRDGLLKTLGMILGDRFGNAGLQLLPEINLIQDLAGIVALMHALDSVQSLEEVRQVIRAIRSPRMRAE
jgi:hypothetical protein